MEQSQFNHIIYFHLRSFAFELACEKADLISVQFRLSHQMLHDTQKLMETFTEHHVFEVQTKDAFIELRQVAEKARRLSAEPVYKLLGQKTQAQDELQDYMNLICPNTSSPTRIKIDHIFNSVKKSVREGHDEQTTEIDNRLAMFEQAMCAALNEAFDREYSYKAPLSNSFFMAIMSHSTTRSIAGILLLAGLASLSVGVLAVAGLFPALASAVAISLTITGAASTALGAATLTTGFFKHHSPYEIDQNKDHIHLPLTSPGLST